MTDANTILLTIAGTLGGAAIGGVTSWYFSQRYYLKSGADLNAAFQSVAGDNQKLLQAVNTLGRMLEQAGIGKPTFDAAGNLTGLVVTASFHAVLEEATLSATATESPPAQYDRQHEQPLPENQDGSNA